MRVQAHKEWTTLAWGANAPVPESSLFVSNVAVVLDPDSPTLPFPVDLVFVQGGQTIDNAYQLRHQAELVVGSQKGAQLPTSLLSTLQNPDPVQAARAFVREYAARTDSGMQSAIRTSRLENLAGQVHLLVQHLKTQPRDLIYSTMLAIPPMQRDTGEERDLGTFLQALISDERFPEPLQEQAVKARRAYEDIIVSQWSSGDQKALRYTTGASVHLPWRRPEGAPSEWSRDSGWGELLDYVFEGAEPPRGAAPLGTPFAEYKRYISPFQDVRCAYTPSCSAFMRDSVEQHGLWSGAQIGLLRFMGCDGTHSCSEQCACPKAGDVLVQPSGAGPASYTDKLLVRAARFTGQLLGGTTGSVLGCVAGIAVGAWVGYKGAAYKPASAADQPTERGYQRLRDALQPVGGLLGAASSAMRGAAAGLLGGAALGAHFGGLWAQNRTKELVGQLPPRA